jgi:hypothetical protein
LLDDAEKEGFSVEAVEYALRLSQLDELRESALEYLSDTQRWMIDAAKGERKVLRVGDLILLRRHIVNKERGHKLEPKWIGPFYLVGFTKGSRSVTYANVQQPRVIVGRRYIDQVRVYCPRIGRPAQLSTSSTMLVDIDLDDEEWVLADNEVKRMMDFSDLVRTKE